VDYHLKGYKIKKEEVGRACSMHGRLQKLYALQVTRKRMEETMIHRSFVHKNNVLDHRQQ
jgi:hypothetical protein